MARAEQLIEVFTGGNPDILQGLAAMMSDCANWPKDVKAGSHISPEGEAFLKKAYEAAKLAQVR